MKDFILRNSDAIRVLAKFIIPIAIALVVVIVLIVYTRIRQKANKPLESSNGKSRFAATYSGRNAEVSHDPDRQPAQNMSASNATRRMAEPEVHAPAEIPQQQILSRGNIRQQAKGAPREQAKPEIRSDEEGVLEFCLEYLENYRI